MNLGLLYPQIIFHLCFSVCANKVVDYPCIVAVTVGMADRRNVMSVVGCLEMECFIEVICAAPGWPFLNSMLVS